MGLGKKKLKDDQDMNASLSDQDVDMSDMDDEDLMEDAY